MSAGNEYNLPLLSIFDEAKGRSIYRRRELLQILFQCQRHQGSITAGQIRDFRGAMQGLTDKGLFVTTGTFTRDAIKKAIRDGEQLVQRLKELGLGVKITMIESVEVDSDWFTKI